MENVCFQLQGDINHRQTFLYEEGARRLSQNGLIIAVTSLFPGGIGSSSTAKELFRIFGLESYSSTGNTMRAIATSQGYTGEDGFNEFLRENKDNPYIDVKVDSAVHSEASQLAKENGIAVVDSKYMCLLWPIYANSSESPLVLAAGVTAPARVAQDRLHKRAIEDAEKIGAPTPNRNDIIESRRARMNRDKIRLPKVYPQITFSGPPSVADNLSIPPADTSRQIPKEVAFQIVQFLAYIPEIRVHIGNRVV